MADSARTHDLVVYGASGFVGRLLAAYLAEHAPPTADRPGRPVTRQARGGPGRTPGGRRGWPVLAADSADTAALTALAARTRVLATTVGPYARYGLPVVEACARAGTHYADLTGEVLFVRDAIERTDAVATDTGARIVHSCGYDSIPSDLATLLLRRAARADGAGGLTDVTLIAPGSRAAFSGGTIDSMRAPDGGRRRRPVAPRGCSADPYALSPDRAAEPDTRQPAGRRSARPRPDGRWTAPFVMASYNTRIVRRSNALQDWAYGRSLRYGEVMGTGAGSPVPRPPSRVTGGLAAAAGRDELRAHPRAAGPGAARAGHRAGRGGPARRAGSASVVDATTETGRRYRATAAGQGDPGYAATAVMLGESALALALDGDRLPDRAGSLTPATAMGDVLVERLRAAGHTYEVTPA